MPMQNLIEKIKHKLQPAIVFAQENRGITIAIAVMVGITLLVFGASLIRAIVSSTGNTTDTTQVISPTPSVSPTLSVSPSPTASASATPTRRPSPSVSSSPTATKTPTNTPQPNPTNAPTAQPTNTPVPPTATPTTVPTPTVSPTPRPVVTFTPSSLDFGAVEQGTVVQKNITIANQGPGDLIVTSTSISHTSIGACGSAFIVQLNQASIAAGGVSGMPIDFAPSSNSCRWEATLTVNSNAVGSPHTIAITGRGADL